MSSSDTKPLQLSALGQPFTLGMLYDARKDALIPGFTLWDRDSLDSQTSETAQKSSSFKMTASDTIESKSSLMDIEASLNVSWLGGLVEVGGSAKYLNNKKKFKNQSRVTFQYKATTVFKQLSLPALGPLNSQQKQVIENGTATHLVTGILYGANAVFVFDSQKVDASSVQDIQGSMQAVIKKIPTFEIEGSAKIQLTDEEQKLTNQFGCTFYGDLILEKNPSTFVQAVETYTDLPTLLGDKDNYAPLTVWLYPLQALYQKAPLLIKDLSISLSRKIQDTVEDENQVYMRCNDSLFSSAAKNFPPIRKGLSSFQKLCSYYKAAVTQRLAKDLPCIRDGKQNESALTTFLNERENSPFSKAHLDRWLENKERDINIIEACVNMMLEQTDAQIVHTKSELDKVILSPGATDVLCYVFTDLDPKDPCLNSMAKYLETFQAGGTDTEYTAITTDVFTKMREKAQEFITYAKLFKRSKSVRFLITAMPNKKYKGCSIYHYKDYSLFTDSFTKPSVPSVKTITERKHLIWYATDLTLDESTVNKHLTLSQDKKKVTFGSVKSYPNNSERFIDFKQVLCKEPLTARHYWEVEFRGRICFAVAYTSTPKAYSECGWTKQYFTDFNTSWGIFAANSYLLEIVFKYIFPLLNWRTYAPGVQKLGIYLDCPGGTLSFYGVSEEKLKHYGLERVKFDNKSVTFEEHIMWHYLFFIVLVKVKGSTMTEQRKQKQRIGLLGHPQHMNVNPQQPA
ncbi:neoverrucotoxin subunit alpha-like [Vanacampus margaritifer]